MGGVDMKQIDILNAIRLNFIWASNHKDEMEHVVKIYGKAKFDEPEDELLYFWGTSEGIQLCMWFSSLFCAIENIKNLLNVDILTKFPILQEKCCSEFSIYNILAAFRNYCFHVDINFASNNFFDLTFRSIEDTFSRIFDLHCVVENFLKEEAASIEVEFKEEGAAN